MATFPLLIVVVTEVGLELPKWTTAIWDVVVVVAGLWFIIDDAAAEAKVVLFIVTDEWWRAILNTCAD